MLEVIHIYRTCEYSTRDSLSQAKRLAILFCEMFTGPTNNERSEHRNATTAVELKLKHGMRARQT